MQRYMCHHPLPGPHLLQLDFMQPACCSGVLQLHIMITMLQCGSDREAVTACMTACMTACVQ